MRLFAAKFTPRSFFAYGLGKILNSRPDPCGPFAKARPCLLEPIHEIEVRIPEDCVGKVMGDLSSRRGNILGVEVDGAFHVIRAQVPAKELYRYSSSLRSLTGGRGVHGEEFSHYAEMPREMEQWVIDEAKGKRAGK